MNKIRKLLTSLSIALILISHASADVKIEEIKGYHSSPITISIKSGEETKKILAKTDDTDYRDITDTKELHLDKNTTISILSYDENGDEHYYTEKINCFDYQNPRITHTQNNDMVIFDGADDKEVKQIVINGDYYDGITKAINLNDYNSETITAYSIDLAGNKSETITIKNTAYLDKIKEQKRVEDELKAKKAVDKAQEEKAKAEKTNDELRQDIEKRKQEIERLKKSSDSTNASSDSTTAPSFIKSFQSNRSNITDTRPSTPEQTETEQVVSSSKDDTERIKLEDELKKLEKEKKELEEARSKKEVKSFVTKDGKEFHIIRSKNPEENQIMLLNEVTPEELIAIMNEDKEEETEDPKENTIDPLEEKRMKQEAEEKAKEAKEAEEMKEAEELEEKQARNSSILFYLILILGGIGLFFFIKNKKKNRDTYEHDDGFNDETEDSDNFEERLANQELDDMNYDLDEDDIDDYL